MNAIQIQLKSGAKAKIFAQIALDNKLYDPNRVFVYLFKEIATKYNTREMSKWCVALAYEDENPIGVLLSTNMWVGVYVHPSYRRKGVGTQLMTYAKPSIKSYLSCSDDPIAIAFFNKLKCPSVDD